MSQTKNLSSFLAQYEDTVFDYTISVRIIVVAQSRLLLPFVTQDQSDIIYPYFSGKINKPKLMMMSKIQLCIREKDIGQVKHAC